VKRYRSVVKISNRDLKVFYLDKRGMKFLTYFFPSDIYQFPDRITYLKENLRRILQENKIKGKNIKVLIDEDDVLFYTNKFPVVSEDELASLCRYELKKYLQQDFIYDYSILKRQEDKKRIIAILSGISPYLLAVSDIGIKIDTLTLPFDTTFLFFKNFYKDGKYIVIDFNCSWTNFLYMNNGELLYLRGVKNISTNSFIDVLQREFQIDRSKAEEKIEGEPLIEDKENYYRIRPFLEDIVKEINITISFISDIYEERAERCYLIGEVGKIKGLPEYFKDIFHIDFIVPTIRYMDEEVPVDFIGLYSGTFEETKISFSKKRKEKNKKSFIKEKASFLLFFIMVVLFLNNLSNFYMKKIKIAEEIGRQVPEINYYEKENLYPDILLTLGIYIPEDTEIDIFEADKSSIKISGKSVAQSSIKKLYNSLLNSSILKDIRIGNIEKGDGFFNFEIYGNIK